MFADGVNGDVDFSIGITVFNRKLLIDMVNRAYDSEGQSVNKDIIASKVSQLKVFGFLHRGFCAVMDSEKTYYEANMALLEPSVRKDLFNPERPILTKTRDDMPTRYGTRSVTENCFIADGCVIDGTVKNSVIFRGVRVAKGAVVENSILMQGVSVASNAKLSYVISDKNATIGPDMVLSGTDGKTFIVKKNQSY